MALFIWREPFNVSYAGGIIFAVADNYTEARKQALAARRRDGSLSLKGGRLGEPDEIIEGPYAETYEWSE